MATVDSVMDALGLSAEGLADWLQIELALVADGAASIANDDSIAVFVPVGHAVAELATLADLMRLVDQKDRALRGRNLNVFTPSAFAVVHDHARETIQILHELRTRAYGKVVVARDVDTGQKRVFRIAQANLGFPEIGVINRLAPIAQHLVSARLGDEVTTPKGTYEVLAVVHLERFADDREADFRRMDLEDRRLAGVVTLEHLHQAVAMRRDELRRALLEGTAVGALAEIDAPEVRREDAEGLSAHFYTRTTQLQETLMQRPSSGLVVVHGVAGSGKTSVALGRTKVLCDRGPDDGEDDPTYFRPEAAVGFVLNEQLATYLAKACTTLALYDMKVREYRDLREELIGARKLDGASLGRAPERRVHPGETSMRWCRALDATMADVIADAIENAVAEVPQERESARKQVVARSVEQNRALDEKWSMLKGDVADVAAWLRKRERNRNAFRLEGLAARLDEPRDRFARELEADPAWNAPKNRELRQNVRNALRERLVRALRLIDAYVLALRSDALLAEVAALVETESLADETIESARGAVKEGKLTDAAIDALLVIAHAMSVGYAGRHDRDPIIHLAQPAYYSQVFIDEYQDFTEVQIHLMAAQANPVRRAVTMVGDLRQQLRTARRIDLAACFPLAAKEERAPAMLVENKRQTGSLARLSQRFREQVLGDAPSPGPAVPVAGPLPRLLSVTAEQLVDAIEGEVLRLPRGASVAVICESPESAQRLERELRDSLTGQFRETRLSTHRDLTRRFFVHFTTALDAKGLEFDAVIVPLAEDVGPQADATTMNAAYVAISRPRQHLSIVAANAGLAATLEKWAAEGFLEIALVEPAAPRSA